MFQASSIKCDMVSFKVNACDVLPLFFVTMLLSYEYKFCLAIFVDGLKEMWSRFVLFFYDNK